MDILFRYRDIQAIPHFLDCHYNSAHDLLLIGISNEVLRYMYQRQE